MIYNKIKPWLPNNIGYLYSLLLLSGFAIALILFRVIETRSSRYEFLLWNLFLAWLPLIFAWALFRRTPKGLNWSWLNFILFALWLLFLPNAFYLVSDYIHLGETGEIGLMYDLVLIGTYAWCGFVLGYTSLYLIHKRTIQRFGQKAHWLPIACLMLSGFAIYLGRYLRWNSWDIITNPFGILFDVSNSIINPINHSLTFSATLLFFSFLAAIYFVLWQGAKILTTTTKE